ncbi:MAG: M23 family metallopeptidase [Actinomycetes bacterium]
MIKSTSPQTSAATLRKPAKMLAGLAAVVAVGVCLAQAPASAAQTTSSTAARRAHARTVPYTGATYWPLVGNFRSSAVRGIHDLNASIGTLVYAVRDGVVRAQVNGGTGYGRFIQIQHDGMPRPVNYAHLSRAYVKPGQHVVAGQVIGKTGMTGNTFGPHIHVDFGDGSNYVYLWLKEHGVVSPPSKARASHRK